MHPTNSRSAGTPPNSGSGVLKPTGKKLELTLTVKDMSVFKGVVDCLMLAVSLLEGEKKEAVNERMKAAGILFDESDA